jgi:hypothetical protein
MGVGRAPVISVLLVLVGAGAAQEAAEDLVDASRPPSSKWNLDNVGLSRIPGALPPDVCAELIRVCDAAGWATEADSIDGYNVQDLQVVHHGLVQNAAAYAVIEPYLAGLKAWLDGRYGPGSGHAHAAQNFNALDWVFARKYATGSVRDSLQGHKDSNRHSINIPLNSDTAFDGGQLYFVPPDSELGLLVDAKGVTGQQSMLGNSMEMMKPRNVPAGDDC